MNDFEPHHLDIAQTDPKLDALLDDALAPGEVPPGLNDRILAATVDQLPQTHAAEASGPVIGRISGGSFPWRSAAAVVLLGSVVGGLFWATQNPAPLINNDFNLAEVTEKVELGLDQLADAALQAEPIDDEIAMLSMQLSAAQSPGFWEEDALDSLDTAITFEAFGELHDELDIYF